MSKLLYIKANAKPEGNSRTFKISDSFIKAYKESHPQDEVITLDLYKENIKFLDIEDINTVFGIKDESSKNHPILKYAYEFAEADKIVVAEPMWNLSIPAILKAYIDYVSVTGITFKYTAQGPVGLCKAKAINISARGGQYSTNETKDFEMGDRYLRTIFAFFGINDFQTIAADELDVQGQDVESIIQNKINEAIKIAKSF